MVEGQELVRTLIEALSFKGIVVSGRLGAFLREMRDSDMDEMTWIEIERKIGRMLEESIHHSKMLTKKMKGGLWLC